MCTSVCFVLTKASVRLCYSNLVYVVMHSENSQCNILLQPMSRAPLLPGSYVFIPPPVPSWGRCHTSSLIASQISVSLYDTPGSCSVGEHQQSRWFCRSTSSERVQLLFSCVKQELFADSSSTWTLMTKQNRKQISFFFSGFDHI